MRTLMLDHIGTRGVRAYTPGFQMSSTLRAHPVVKPGNFSVGLSVGGFTRASDLVRAGEGSRVGELGKHEGWAMGAKGAGLGSDGFSSRVLAEIHERSVGASKGGRQVMTLKSTFVNASSVPPAMAAAARVQAAAQEIAGRAEGIALKTNSW